jgi:hypothetical protein
MKSKRELDYQSSSLFIYHIGGIVLWPTAHGLSFRQFVRDFFGVEDLAQDFEHAA